MTPPEPTALLIAVRRYADLGLCVIPVKPMSKFPDLSRWQQYQSRRPTDKEIESWFSVPRNIGIVCGSVSGGLIVVDFDDVRAFAFCFLESPVGRTPVAKTGKGVHVYTRLKGGGVPKGTTFQRKGDAKTWLPVDIKGEGGYVVAPPSVHPTGKAYEWVGEFGSILEVDEDALVADLKRRSEEWPFVETFAPSWETRPVGHDTALGFAAFAARKLGWGEERTKDFMRRACAAVRDPEIADRLKAVETTYANLAAGKDVAYVQYLGADISEKLEVLVPQKRRGRTRAVGGKEDGTRLETSIELPDGRIAEEIATRDGEAFVVYDPGTDTVTQATELCVGGAMIRPVPLDDKIRKTLTLADGVEEYSSTVSLLGEMEDLARIFDPVKETAMWKMWIRGGLTSWILGPIFAAPVEKYATIFRTPGTSESGKGRALTVCRYLFYRSMFFQKTHRVPSLFRAIDPWQGTLVLDEADVRDDSESADFIQFLNARATGSVIPRYSTEIDDNRYFVSFGNTILATRKAYTDDGVNSRTAPLSAEATTKDVDLIPPKGWLERAMALQRKLLLWRLRHVARIRRGELVLPTRLPLEGVRSFRVREAFLVLSTLAEEEPSLSADIRSIARELERRLVVERAASPTGLILSDVYGRLSDEWGPVPDGTEFRVQRTWAEKDDKGEERRRVEVLTLGKLSEALGKAFSPSEIARFWRGLGQTTKAQDRVDGRRQKGIILVSDPARLEREFRKYVVGAESLLPLFGLRLDDFDPITPSSGGVPESPRDISSAGTSGTAGTAPRLVPTESVPLVLAVPAEPVSLAPSAAGTDVKESHGGPSGVPPVPTAETPHIASLYQPNAPCHGCGKRGGWRLRDPRSADLEMHAYCAACLLKLGLNPPGVDSP